MILPIGVVQYVNNMCILLTYIDNNTQFKIFTDCLEKGVIFKVISRSNNPTTCHLYDFRQTSIEWCAVTWYICNSISDLTSHKNIRGTYSLCQSYSKVKCPDSLIYTWLTMLVVPTCLEVIPRLANSEIKAIKPWIQVKTNHIWQEIILGPEY